MERSKFTIGGVAALDVNRVQNAALEAVSKPVLTPQQQLEMLKNQRAKSKPKKTKLSAKLQLVCNISSKPAKHKSKDDP